MKNYSINRVSLPVCKFYKDKKFSVLPIAVSPFTHLFLNLFNASGAVGNKEAQLDFDQTKRLCIIYLELTLFIFLYSGTTEML